MAKSKESRPAGGPSPDAIAKRAYELSLQRGSVPGHEIDDWLQAEAELTAASVAESRETRKQPEPRADTDAPELATVTRLPGRRSPAPTPTSRRTLRQ